MIYNKRLYVVGGLTDEGVASKEIEWLDQGRNQWSVFKFALPFAMDGMRVQALETHHTLLIVGGRVEGAKTSSVIEFSLEDGSCLYHSSMTAARSGHKLLSLGGKLAVLGGEASAMSCESFDPDSKRWSVEPKISQQLASLLKQGISADLAAAITYPTTLEPFDDTEEEYEEVDLNQFDLDTMSEEAVQLLMEKKKRMNLIKEKRQKVLDSINQAGDELKQKVRLHDPSKHLILFGNVHYPFIAAFDLDTSALAYHPVPSGFELAASLSSRRLLQNKILLWRREVPHSRLLSYYVFDIGQWRLSKLPPRSKRVFDSEVEQIDETGFYLVGGLRECPGRLASNAIECFQFATKKWATCGQMLVTRQKFSLFADRGLLFLLGGINNDGETESSMEFYDPATNACSPSPLKYICKIQEAASLNHRGKVLVFGGKSKPDKRTDAVYQLDPTTGGCKFVSNITQFAAAAYCKPVAVNRLLFLLFDGSSEAAFELAPDLRSLLPAAHAVIAAVRLFGLSIAHLS